MSATVPIIVYGYDHIHFVGKTLLKEVNAIGQPNTPTALERIKNTKNNPKGKK